jgi:integrase
VVEYRHSSRSPRWVIEGIRLGGKRRRLFFRTKTAAEQELTRIKTKQHREGVNALELPDSARVMAAELSEQLQEYGKTIRDAGDFYITYLRDCKGIKVQALADEYLSTRKHQNVSALYLKDLRLKLRIFCEAFGPQPARILTGKQIASWVHSLALAPQTVNSYLTRVSAVFSYGVRHGHLERNPTNVIERLKFVDKAPEIFTVDQLRAVLTQAADMLPGARLVPLIAVGAFAGLRTTELMRMEWEDINFRRGFIEVPAHKAKTARRRLISIAPNLQAWLAPYANHTGPVWCRSRNGFNWNLLEVSKRAGLPKWPHNGLRHSFASYHLAHHCDAAKLALAMGHTGPGLIFSNYREVVHPDEAERYWNLFPALPQQNVIPLSAA